MMRVKINNFNFNKSNMRLSGGEGIILACGAGGPGNKSSPSALLFYPPVSTASGEVTNLNEIKNTRPPAYCVREL